MKRYKGVDVQEMQVPLPVGSVVRGHYLVEGLLGKGCSSAVYLVRDQRIKHATDNHFALKEVLAPNKHERNRLIFDGALLSRLHHRALPRIYHVFNDGNYDHVYLLMEYIEGTSLEALRQQQLEKRFSWSEAIARMAPMIDALDNLHCQQPPIIHRDIKPTNIIVSEARTVLVDFGMIEEYDPDLSTVDVRSCASAYRAPEQYSRGADTRTDVYGLGATFYTLVTGIVPLDALSRMAHMGSEKVDPLKPVNEVVPSVPAHVADTINRAMSVYAHDRFSSVERFWEALWESVNASPVELPSPIPGNMPSVSSRRPVVLKPAPALENVGATSLQKQPPVKRLPIFVSGRLGVLTLLVRMKQFWEALWSPRKPRSPMSSSVPLATSRWPDVSKPEAPVARPATVVVTGHRPPAPRARKHDALLPGGSVPIPEPERAVEQTAAMLLPKPLPVVSMVDSVKEPEDLDATEPRLPVVSMPIADKEREGSDTTKSLPEVPQVAPKLDDVKEPEDLEATEHLPKVPRIVPVPEGIKEPEDLDAAKPLPEAPVVSVSESVKEKDLDAAKLLPEVPQVVPMSTRIKEREDLDDIIDLRKPPPVVRSPLSLRKLGMVLSFLALLIGLGVVAGFLSHMPNHAAAPIPTVTAQATRPTPSPTPASTSSPLIAGTYNGTIDDLSSNVSTSLSLIGVRQSQGKMTGYLVLGSGLERSGPLSGTIDTAKHLQFTVTDGAGHAILFFEGAMQSAIRLSGDYYQCSPNPSQNSQCNRVPSGGYGIWSAVLVS